MEPAIDVALLWLLFGGTHVGLATRRSRAERAAGFPCDRHLPDPDVMMRRQLLNLKALAEASARA
jgi:hypothetical protein